MHKIVKAGFVLKANNVSLMEGKKAQHKTSIRKLRDSKREDEFNSTTNTSGGRGRRLKEKLGSTRNTERRGDREIRKIESSLEKKRTKHAQHNRSKYDEAPITKLSNTITRKH